MKSVVAYEICGSLLDLRVVVVVVVAAPSVFVVAITLAVAFLL